MELLVATHIFPGLKSIGRQCVHISQTDGGKLVLSVMERSGQIVVRPRGAVDQPEFGVARGGPEDCTSTVVIPEAAAGFILGPVHTSQNQEPDVRSHICDINITATERLLCRFVVLTIMLMILAVKNKSMEDSML